MNTHHLEGLLISAVACLSPLACIPTEARPAAGVVNPTTAQQSDMTGQLRARGLVPVATDAVLDPNALPGFVAFYMELRTREQARARVLDGATVRTGDQITFFVGVEAPTYIYLVQVFPDGRAEVVYPQVGDVQLAGGKIQRIPAERTLSFAFDQNTGTERIFLMASENPLADADRQLARLIGQIRTTNRLPQTGKAQPKGAAQPSPEPTHASTSQAGHFGLAQRGLKLVREGGQVMAAKPDAAGIAVIAVELQHVE